MPTELRSGVYRVVARFRGYPYLTFTLGKRKGPALAYDKDLHDLRNHDRRDVFEALAADQITMSEIHRALETGSAATLDLDKLGVGSGDMTLGGLFDEWTLYIVDVANASSRTRRPYAESTRERYRQGWDNFFRHHPKGRLAPPATLSASALAEFRSRRIKIDGVTMSSVNRDMTAIQSFLRWARDKKQNAFPRPPKIDKFREPDYAQDDRHLEPAEWAVFRAHLPSYWQPFFDLLVYTGLRLGEGQALQYRDVTHERIQVREGKTPKARRDVWIMPEMEPWVKQVVETPARPFDFVWPPRLRNKDEAYRVFVDTCLAAGLHDQGEAAMTAHRVLHETWQKTKRRAKDPLPEPTPPDPLPVRALFSPHSLRHSFGVAAARAGLSLVEIRDLLGHSTTGVTERYAKFQPRDEHRRDQMARISAAYAQKMPDVKVVSPPAPQTAPPLRAYKQPKNKGIARVRTMKQQVMLKK